MILLKYDSCSKENNIDVYPVHGNITFCKLTNDYIADLVALYPHEFGLVTQKRAEKRIISYHKKGYPCFLALDGSDVVGFFWAIPWIPPLHWMEDKSAVEISNLYVIPSQRNNNIAKRLLYFGMNQLLQQGVKTIYSRISSIRIPSIRAHLGCQFVPVATIEILKIFRKRFYKSSNCYLEEWQCERKIPACILIGDDSSNILTQARELGERGIKVYHLFFRWAAVMSRSRFVNESFHVQGDIKNELCSIIDRISSRHEQPPVIYYAHEKLIPILVDIYNFFGDKVIFINPPGRCSQWISKVNQNALAREVGFSVSSSVCLHKSSDIRHELSRLLFPILCRPESPLDSELNFKTRIYTNLNHAVNEIELLMKNDNRMIVQTYIPGDDSQVWFYLCACDDRGTVIAETVGRKILQFPPGAGIMSAGKTAENEDLGRLARKYFHNLALPGVMGLEAKQHPGSNRYYFIEVNLRPENICGISSQEVPVNWIGYRQATGNLPDNHKRVQCPAGRYWVHAGKSLCALFMVNKVNAPRYFFEIFCAGWKNKKWALWNIHDPKPLWGYLLLSVRKIMARYQSI